MFKNIKSQKIGIFGGTFDPIHLGHIKTAHLALKYLELNKVLFIPAGDPYLKSNHIEITNSQMRLEMVRLAIEDEKEKKFLVEDIEIKKEGPSYTLDTVIKLKKEGINPIVILGMDSVLSMTQWKDPETLINECKILAITRPASNLSDFYNLKIKGIREAVEILKVDTPKITSSDIRNRIKLKKDIKNMLSPSVEKFIKDKAIYI